MRCPSDGLVTCGYFGYAPTIFVKLTSAPFMYKAAKLCHHLVPVDDGPQPSKPAKPAKRRRAAESKNKAPKNQHFYFVDQNSSSKEKRAHVMRHHVQEKMKQRKMTRGRVSAAPGVGIAQDIQPGPSLVATQPASNMETSVWESLLLVMDLGPQSRLRLPHRVHYWNSEF